VHMIGAAIISICVRCNLAIAIALVWISNPLTIPPIFYATYRVGAWMMGIPPQDIRFEMSMQWFSQGLAAIWKPLVLGSLTTGLTLAALAYITTRALWRLGTELKWRRRRQRRAATSDKTPHS
jgi:uncharacterized protein